MLFHPRSSAFIRGNNFFRGSAAGQPAVRNAGGDDFATRRARRSTSTRSTATWPTFCSHPQCPTVKYDHYARQRTMASALRPLIVNGLSPRSMAQANRGRRGVREVDIVAGYNSSGGMMTRLIALLSCLALSIVALSRTALGRTEGDPKMLAAIVAAQEDNLSRIHTIAASRSGTVFGQSSLLSNT